MNTIGDGSCAGPILNCEEYDYDGGDCGCPPEWIGCNLICAHDYEAKVGDGQCDSMFNCQKFEYDGNDCEACTHTNCNDKNICMDDYIDSLQTMVGDGTCNVELNCGLYDFDGGDCASHNAQCDNYDCMNSDCLDLIMDYKGDGSCDANFNCAKFDYDGGDCNECMDVAEAGFTCDVNADSTGVAVTKNFYMGDKCVSSELISSSVFDGLPSSFVNGMGGVGNVVPYDSCLSIFDIDPNADTEYFVKLSCLHSSKETVMFGYMDGSCMSDVFEQTKLGGINKCDVAEDCSMKEEGNMDMDKVDAMNHYMSTSTCQANTGKHTAHYYNPGHDSKTGALEACDENSDLNIVSERHETILFRTIVEDLSDHVVGGCTPLPERTNATDFFFTGEYHDSSDVCAASTMDQEACEKSGCCTWEGPDACAVSIAGICPTHFAKAKCSGGYSRFEVYDHHECKGAAIVRVKDYSAGACRSFVNDKDAQDFSAPTDEVVSAPAFDRYSVTISASLTMSGISPTALAMSSDTVSLFYTAFIESIVALVGDGSVKSGDVAVTGYRFVAPIENGDDGGRKLSGPLMVVDFEIVQVIDEIGDVPSSIVNGIKEAVAAGVSSGDLQSSMEKNTVGLEGFEALGVESLVVVEGWSEKDLEDGELEFELDSGGGRVPAGGIGVTVVMAAVAFVW